MKITQALKRAVCLRGDRPALIYGDQSWSYRELQERVARLGSLFVSYGIQRDDRIAMLSSNSDHYWCFYYGVIWSGGIMVPLNHRLSTLELLTIVEDCQPKILLYDSASALKAEALGEVHPDLRLIECDAERGLGYQETHRDAEALPPLPDQSGSSDDVALIVYTGGTTGLPKGVMLTHTNVVSNSLNTIPYLSLSEETVQLHVGPFFHMGAGQRIFTVTQAAGAHVILPAFSVPDIMKTIEAHKINSMVLVPTMMKRLLDDPRRQDFDLSSLRYVSYGAAPMPEALLRRFMREFPECLLSQSYGQTECAPVATGLLHRDHLSTGPYGSKIGTVGRAVSTVEIRIGAESQGLDTGEVGEVLVRGPNVMRGYWNNPEATSSTLRDGWLHTGDVGYLDDDHFLVIVDRMKDMIISGGENVYSSEVENIISQISGIEGCAVIGLPCEQWGEKVHAIIRGDAMSAEQIIEFCRGHLAGYKIPRSFEWLEEPFPLTSTNKINKRLLKETRGGER